jgi:hypothetical protein
VRDHKSEEREKAVTLGLTKSSVTTGSGEGAHLGVCMALYIA